MCSQFSTGLFIVYKRMACNVRVTVNRTLFGTTPEWVKCSPPACRALWPSYNWNCPRALQEITGGGAVPPRLARPYLRIRSIDSGKGYVLGKNLNSF